MRLIYRGAEAELWKDAYLGLQVVRKKRVPKKFRHPSLDAKLRQQRCRNEARLLKRARGAVATPHVLDVSGEEIVMEHVKGRTVKELFNRNNVGNAREIGKSVRRLHDAGIIHSDLTTGNMIVGKKLYFIDFGLGFVSDKAEDRATDLVVLKKMVAASHHKVFKKAWSKILAGYRPGRAIKKKMEEIENRVRYK